MNLLFSIFFFLDKIWGEEIEGTYVPKSGSNIRLVNYNNSDEYEMYPNVENPPKIAPW